MRFIMALALVAVGCGDVSTAGPGTGGAGGDMGAVAGTTGTGGDGSTAGASGTAGQGGAPALPTSCAILVGDVSGEDPAAVWTQCDGRLGNFTTRSSNIRAIVVDGATDAFGAWPTVASYTITPHSGGTVGAPTTDGQCNVDIRFERPATSPPDCVAASMPQRLYVHLVVPAI